MRSEISCMYQDRSKRTLEDFTMDGFVHDLERIPGFKLDQTSAVHYQHGMGNYVAPLLHYRFLEREMPGSKIRSFTLKAPQVEISMQAKLRSDRADLSFHIVCATEDHARMAEDIQQRITTYMTWRKEKEGWENL